MEFEIVKNPENIATPLENMISDSSQICSTDMIDMSIYDAREKKKSVDSKMDSVISLMREVERQEKSAFQAKKQSDTHSLQILVQAKELKRAAQHAKERNEMHAREVYAQKAALATEMEEVQLRVSGVLNEGDGSLADLDKMRIALEKRLSSALMKKEAADKHILDNEAMFAYQKGQMEMAVQEANRLDQQAAENSKLQEFLNDRVHVVNMLQVEICCKRIDVELLKGELEDKKEFNKRYEVEEPLMPIIQGPPVSYGCECGECYGMVKCVKETIVRINSRSKTGKALDTNAKRKMTRKWIEGEIAEAVADYEEDDLDVYQPFYSSN